MVGLGFENCALFHLVYLLLSEGVQMMKRTAAKKTSDNPLDVFDLLLAILRFCSLQVFLNLDLLPAFPPIP